MGFWLSLTASLASLAILVMREAPTGAPALWLAAAAFAVAYGIGFIVFILRALQIGPAGPTVTVNNSAMIFGVLYGLLWLDPHVPNAWVAAGVFGVFVALALVGYGGKTNSGNHRGNAKEWLRLVVAGGALAGLSFVSQTYVGLRHPGIDNSLIFICLGFGLSALLLFFLVGRDPRVLLQSQRELTGGIALGVSNTIGFSLTILAFKEVGAEIVLPVSVTSPMILVTLLGVLVYGERLSRLTWTGCGLAVLSVAAIGYGSILPRAVPALIVLPLPLPNVFGTEAMK